MTAEYYQISYNGEPGKRQIQNEGGEPDVSKISCFKSFV